jgi:hypothetical protein
MRIGPFGSVHRLISRYLDTLGVMLLYFSFDSLGFGESDIELEITCSSSSMVSTRSNRDF